VGVRGEHRIAVHGAAAELRQRMRRGHILRQHPIQRVSQPARLAHGRGLEMAQKDFPRLFCRPQLQEFRHTTPIRY